MGETTNRRPSPQAAATLTELRFPSPGLRSKHATLGKRPH